MRLFIPFLLCLTSLAARAEMAPVTVDAIPFNPAELVIVESGTEIRYDQARLEALGTYKIVTKTPWRAEPAEFIGVRLSDLLELHQLDNEIQLSIVAENGYEVTMPQNVWRNHNAMIATRVDGAPHTRRLRGPLQLVFDMDDDAETSKALFEVNWVWMMSRIEAAK